MEGAWKFLRNFGKCSGPRARVLCVRFVPPQSPTETQSPDDVVSRIQLSPLIILGQNPICCCNNGHARVHSKQRPKIDRLPWTIGSVMDDEVVNREQSMDVSSSPSTYAISRSGLPDPQGQVSSGLVASLWPPTPLVCLNSSFSLDPVVPFLQPAVATQNEPWPVCRVVRDGHSVAFYSCKVCKRDMVHQSCQFRLPAAPLDPCLATRTSRPLKIPLPLIILNALAPS